MAYVRPTLAELYERIKADAEGRLTSDVKIAPSSLWGVFSIVIAGASFLVSGFLDWISKQQFVDTADETGLTRWGAIYGVPRKSPTFATGTVEFTGTAATVVASGTQVQNSAGGVYLTQAAFTIGTSTSVAAEATISGIIGNTDDAELSLVSPLSGVNTDVPVVSGFDDGEDLETVELWVARILQRIQNPPSSGTTGDYERWALTQSAVSYAWGFDAEDWQGAGTVGVAVSGPGFDALTGGEVATVQAYIDTVKPAPAFVTVYTPDPLDVDIQIEIKPNTTTVSDAITAAISELYSADAAPGATMLISRLLSAIGSAGASDFNVLGIDVDGAPVGVANYTVQLDEVPRVGTLTFTALV